MSRDTLLIDGICGLCTRTGKFISKRQVRELDIIEQESKFGNSLLQEYGIDDNSLVLIRKKKAYVRSSAAIRCLLYMRWNWRWIYPIAWLIPFLIRDFCYAIVSKLRS